MTIDNSLTTAAQFQIVEMTGSQRTVTLNTRGLPYRPFTLKGKQRTEITWYPGNPEATGTVLGASEDPTTINGKWKDMFLASSGSGPPGQGGTALAPIAMNGTQVTTAKDACVLFDDIRRQGQELKVTWDEITRVGYLTLFEQSWENLHDVAWTCEFSWISQGEPTAATVLDGGSTDDTNDQLSAQSINLNTLALPSFPVPPDFTTLLVGALGTVNNAVSNAVNAGSVQATGATTPTSASQRTFASTNDVVSGSMQVVAVLDAQPPRVLISNGTPTSPPLANLSLGDVVKSETYVRTTQLAARKLQRTAAISRAALMRALQNDLIGVWQASAGEDLRDVSDVFYGSRLQWRGLLLFNELASTELSLGQLVLVPRALPNVTTQGTS